MWTDARLANCEFDLAEYGLARGLTLESCLASSGPIRERGFSHLASAISIGEELDAFITYDVRLADAARAAGLTVVVPA